MSSFDIPNIGNVTVDGFTYLGIESNPRRIDDAVKNNIIKNRIKNSDDYEVAMGKIDKIIKHFEKLCSTRTPTVMSKTGQPLSCAALHSFYTTFKKNYSDGTQYGGKSKHNVRYSKYNRKNRINHNRKSRSRKQNKQ